MNLTTPATPTQPLSQLIHVLFPANPVHPAAIGTAGGLPAERVNAKRGEINQLWRLR